MAAPVHRPAASGTARIACEKPSSSLLQPPLQAAAGRDAAVQASIELKGKACLQMLAVGSRVGTLQGSMLEAGQALLS